MIWAYLFGWVGTVAGWLGALLPTTGCSAVTSFTGFNIGYFANYVDMTAMVAAFSMVLAFEAAVFSFRLVLFIYRLIPLNG